MASGTKNPLEQERKRHQPAIACNCRFSLLFCVFMCNNLEVKTLEMRLATPLGFGGKQLHLHLVAVFTFDETLHMLQRSSHHSMVQTSQISGGEINHSKPRQSMRKTSMMKMELNHLNPYKSYISSGDHSSLDPTKLAG